MDIQTPNIIGGNLPSLLTATHGFSVDNGVDVVTAGVKGYFHMPYDYTITGWSLIGNISGAATVDVWSKHLAIPTVTDTIVGTAKPSTSSQFQSSTTLTGWNTHITAGDIVGYNIDNIALFNQLTFNLHLLRV